MKGYQKRLIARRLNDLALNMRSIAYELKLNGKLTESSVLYEAALKADRWVDEIFAEDADDIGENK